MSVGSVFKAISDPTRREILKLLNEKDLSAGEIAEHFDISKPALTKHLNILRDSGVLALQKQAKSDTEQLRTPINAISIFAFCSFLMNSVNALRNVAKTGKLLMID